MVPPPVQRLEAGGNSMVRITATPDTARLPHDRESLFYFNLRKIPPHSSEPNVMQIALQTKIKLFYRPAAIALEQNTVWRGQLRSVWREQLRLTRTTAGYRIKNPTPYFITVIDLTEKGLPASDIQPVMIAPKSSENVRSAVLRTPVLTYINGYGGRPQLTFRCQGDSCQVSES